MIVDNGRSRILGEQVRAGAVVHPLRRLPRRLPGLPQDRRPRLRRRLLGAHRRRAQSPARRASSATSSCPLPAASAGRAPRSARRASRWPSSSASSGEDSVAQGLDPAGVGRRLCRATPRWRGARACGARSRCGLASAAAPVCRGRAAARRGALLRGRGPLGRLDARQGAPAPRAPQLPGPVGCATGPARGDDARRGVVAGMGVGGHRGPAGLKRGGR